MLEPCFGVDRNNFFRKAPIFLYELDNIDHLIADAPVPVELMKNTIENDVATFVYGQFHLFRADAY